MTSMPSREALADPEEPLGDVGGYRGSPEDDAAQTVTGQVLDEGTGR